MSESATREFASSILDQMAVGDFIADGGAMKREPIVQLVASIRQDRQAVRDLLRQSLDCCAILPSDKLQVLEQEVLEGLHAKAAEFRARAEKNEAILDRLDSAHTRAAVGGKPGLEPTVYAASLWVKGLRDSIERASACIRVSAATWLQRPEGLRYSPSGDGELPNITSHPKVAQEVAKYQPIIEAAEKELPVAQAYLKELTDILKDAQLPPKVELVPSTAKRNEYNQCIQRAPGGNMGYGTTG